MIDNDLYNCTNLFQIEFSYQYYTFLINYINNLLLLFLHICEFILCKSILNCNYFINKNNNPPNYYDITQSHVDNQQNRIMNINTINDEPPKYEEVI